MDFKYYNKVLANVKAPSELKTRTLEQMNLETERKTRPMVKIALGILTAAMICVFSSVTIFAVSIFSPLEGDDLAFRSQYNGDGVITVSVENRSNKPLKFQKAVRLMQWSTGKEIMPIDAEKIDMTGVEIGAKSTGKMSIDLSKAYDIAMLEKPLVDDHYYLILTNNNFIFGQDWHCSIEFSKTVITEKKDRELCATEGEILDKMEDRLKFYFEATPLSYEERLKLDQEYIKAYQMVLESSNRKIIPSVCPERLVINPKKPVVFDDQVSEEEQSSLYVQRRLKTDLNGKMLATQGEKVIVLSAMFPYRLYPDCSLDLPLFYIFCYEKNKIQSSSDSAFVYGNLYTFQELKKWKVYEDDKYICYNLSHLIYTDLDNYIDSYLKFEPDAVYNEQIEKRIHRIYHYFDQNMSSLFSYKRE